MTCAIPSHIRRIIRHGLTHKWAGSMRYSATGHCIIERTWRPDIWMYIPGKEPIHEVPPPPEYKVIFGQSNHPKRDFDFGRKIGFWKRDSYWDYHPFSKTPQGYIIGKEEQEDAIRRQNMVDTPFQSPYN